MSNAYNPVRPGPAEPLAAADELDEIEPLAVEPVPVMAIPVAPPPRFCRACGAEWQSGWVECLGCQVNTRRATSLGEVKVEQRAVKSAVGLYLALLGVCAVGLLVSLGIGDGLDVEFAGCVALAAITFGWAIASRREVAPLLRRTPNVGWAGVAVGLSFVTFAIAAGTIGAARRAFHLPAGGGSMSEPFLGGGYGWGMVVLCVCVQPAVVEELAFRGVILGGLRRVLNPAEAVLVSAMMFMILHLSFVRFPHMLALGLVAGFLRTRTRSLYPCVLLHFSHNLLCLVAEWAGPR